MLNKLPLEANGNHRDPTASVVVEVDHVVQARK